MIEELPTKSDHILGFKMSGKLHDEDYKLLGPRVEAAIAKEGKIRMLAWMHDFHGWDMKALWDDTKFDLAHYKDFERIALVGDKKWEEWMATVCKPFVSAEVKYFNEKDIDAAWLWLGEREETPT